MRKTNPWSENQTITDTLELRDVIEEMAEDISTGCIIEEYGPCDTPEQIRWIQKYIDMRWTLPAK